MAEARRERQAIDERIAEVALSRSEWEVRSAGLAERRRVLTERLRRWSGGSPATPTSAGKLRHAGPGWTPTPPPWPGCLEVIAAAQERLDSALAELRERYRLQLEAVKAGGARLEELRRQRAASEHELAAARSRLQKIELDLVEATIRRETVVETLRHDLACTPDDAVAAPAPELAEGVDPPSRIEQLETELAALGPVNPLALEELSELGERHQFLEAQVEDVRHARRELHHVIRTLDEEIMHVFDSAFADVNEHFSTLVNSLFPGGTGRLSLTDPEDLLDTGVDVEVRPAGRNVRRLSLLSGGERSLVALAFLFAVFRSRPSPFYLMDEVEAALDDVNLQRFLGLVHEFRGEAQLIIVSHQKRTMEAADALYGVTMAPGGSSKVVSQKVPRDRVDPDIGIEAADGPGEAGDGAGGWADRPGDGTSGGPEAGGGQYRDIAVDAAVAESTSVDDLVGSVGNDASRSGSDPTAAVPSAGAPADLTGEATGDPGDETEGREQKTWRSGPPPTDRTPRASPGSCRLPMSIRCRYPTPPSPPSSSSSPPRTGPTPPTAPTRRSRPMRSRRSPGRLQPIRRSPRPPTSSVCRTSSTRRRSPTASPTARPDPPLLPALLVGSRSRASGRGAGNRAWSGPNGSGKRAVIEPSLVASGSDVLIALVIAVPLLLVGGGVAVGMRLRGRGGKSAVPVGEVASDAPTDVELSRSAEAVRSATAVEPVPDTGRAAPEPEPEPGPNQNPSRSRPPTGDAWARPGACWRATSARCAHGGGSRPPPGTTWRRPSSGPTWAWGPPMHCSSTSGAGSRAGRSVALTPWWTR